LFLALPVYTQASGRFTDVPLGNWAHDAVERWSAPRYGIIHGSDGRFMPHDGLTYGSLAAFLSRTLGYERRVPVLLAAGGWSGWRVYIGKAAAAGIYDGTKLIDSEAVITREQAIRYTALAFGVEPIPGDTIFADDHLIDTRYKPYINAFVQLGYLNPLGVGGGRFAPQNPYTRAQYIVVLDRMISEILDTSDYGQVYHNNLIIRSGGVTVSDAIIYGNLIVGQGVGDGEVTFDNVRVFGDTIVFGGGAESIKIINGSSVGNLTVARVDGAVRVFADDGSEVEMVFINDGNDGIIIEGFVKNMIINTDTTVTVNAVIGSISVQAPHANLLLGAETVVRCITVEETASSTFIKLEKGAFIETFFVDADNVTLTISEGAAVRTLILSETAKWFVLNGDGVVGSSLSDIEDVEIPETLPSPSPSPLFSPIPTAPPSSGGFIPGPDINDGGQQQPPSLPTGSAFNQLWPILNAEFNKIIPSNNVTAQTFVDAVNISIAAFDPTPNPPFVINWHVPFTLTPATITASGLITGTIRLTQQNETRTQSIHIIIPQLVPEFVPAVFTVNFILDGGVYVGDQDLLEQIIIEGHNAAGLTQNPTKDGYTFKGWYPVLNLFNVNANRTFTALWEVIHPVTFIVKFELDGGVYLGDQDLLEQTIIEGQNATKLTQNLIKDGYTFKGWYPVFNLTNVDENRTFTALWEAIPPITFIVNFELDSGVYAGDHDLLEQTIFEGQNAIKLTQDPTKDGYTFKGWYPALNLTNVNANRIFTALWEAIPPITFIVKFELDGGVYAGDHDLLEQTIIEGQNATKLTQNPSKDGYIFEGWYPKLNLINVDENRTFTALWEAIPTATFIVKFELDGGIYLGDQDLLDQTIIEGQNANKLTQDPIKNDYTFKGWYPALNLTNVDTNRTFTAKWEMIPPVTFTIKFELDSGIYAGNQDLLEQTIIEGQNAIKLTQDPSKDGYTFEGWHPTLNLTNVDADRTFTALWKTIPPVTFTVKFELDGGVYVGDQDLLEQTIIEGQSATELVKDPTKDGYTFEGWYPLLNLTNVDENRTFTAQWEAIPPITFTIKFELDGGVYAGDQDLLEQTVIEGQNATGLTKNPTKDGYTFKGWYPALNLTNVDVNRIFTTLWEAIPPVTFTIKFELDGGVYAGDQDLLEQTVIEGQNATGLTKNPTKDGYIFKGWYPALNLTNVDANRTFTALWEVILPVTFIVKFELDGGVYAGDQDLLEQTIIESQNATELTKNLTKDGYTFKGWYPVLNLTNVDGNRTFTAQWEVIPPVTFIVNFELDGGVYLGNQDLLEQTIIEGQNATELTQDPIRDGYTFKGWYPILNLANVDANHTFTAKWEVIPPVTFTIKFELDGGIYADDQNLLEQTIIEGKNATGLTKNPTKNGYTFKGWYPALNLTNVDANRTFTALWETIPPVTFTVKFELNGGVYAGNQNLLEQIIIEGQNAIELTQNPIKDGYTFEGWYPTLNLTNVDANRTFTALWKTIPPVTFTVKFELDGGFYLGDQDLLEQTIIEGQNAIKLTQDPIKNGYTFNDWYPALYLTNVDENRTFTAKWEVIPPVTFIVNFELDGGVYLGDQDLLEQIIIEGQNATELTLVPSKDGYKFKGWYPALNLTNVDENRTFTAQWEAIPPVTFTVKFELDGGVYAGDQDLLEQTIIENQNATELTKNPTKDGYTFEGWHPALNLTNVDANRTFTALWEAIPPDITDFTFTPVSDLQESNDNTAVNAIVGSFSDPIGGQGTFIYTLVAGSGDDDNALFIIDGDALRVGSAALVAGIKNIRVQVSDGTRNYVRALQFTVEATPVLNGTVGIMLNNETGMLTASYSEDGNIHNTGAVSFLWSGAGVDSGNTSATFDATDFLGTVLTVSVSTTNTSGDLTASTTVFQVVTAMEDSNGNDDATLNPATEGFFEAGDTLAIAVTFDKSKFVSFNVCLHDGTDTLDTDTPSNKTAYYYTVNATDAYADGVITITAAFHLFAITLVTGHTFTQSQTLNPLVIHVSGINIPHPNTGNLIIRNGTTQLANGVHFTINASAGIITIFDIYLNTLEAGTVPLTVTIIIDGTPITKTVILTVNPVSA